MFENPDLMAIAYARLREGAKNYANLDKTQGVNFWFVIDSRGLRIEGTLDYHHIQRRVTFSELEDSKIDPIEYYVQEIVAALQIAQGIHLA